MLNAISYFQGAPMRISGLRTGRGSYRFGIMLLAIVVLAACAGGSTVAPDNLTLQRELFQNAVQDAREGRIAEATQAKAALQGYVLLPYLELELLKAQIHDTAAADFDRLYSAHAGSVVGSLMHRAWLTSLKMRQQWPEFLAYAGDRAPRGMRCEYATALRATGQDRQADKETRSIWLTGYSLPELCDPVLERWLERLSLQERHEVHWQRAKLALQQGQSQLARYLLRGIPGTEHYQNLLQSPDELYQLGERIEVSDFSRLLVMHTLKRLAGSDAQRSNALWHQLDRRFAFTPSQNHSLRDSFAREIIAGGEEYARDWINANDPNFEDHYLTEWRIRLALKDRDWPAAQQYIAALPEKQRAKSDWQYWWARADIENNQRMTDEAEVSLKALASERGYYSFLAADMLSQDYQLGAKRTVNLELLGQVEQIPGVQRAKELYWHNLDRNAITEWRVALRKLTREQQVVASQLALDWGWSYAAVSSAIGAREWDDLELRFPLAFKSVFEQHAKAQNIELNWAYAIARQESAFDRHAQSRVGARGVMQLMPSTAHTIARAMGRPLPKLKELHTAQTNIEMGSFYLRHLQDRFAGNHILATAAYNAGPERVARVLARQKDALPADIWIENLPYGETREYIKNVLAFSVVYGLKLPGCSSPSLQSGCNTEKGERYTFINSMPAATESGSDGI